MENQGFYLKFGEFAGKTTSLDTKLHVKKKKSLLLLPFQAGPTQRKKTRYYLKEEFTPVGTTVPSGILPNQLKFEPTKETLIWIKANTHPHVGGGRAHALMESFFVWILFDKVVFFFFK